MPLTNTAVFPQAMQTAVAVCTAAKTTYNDTTNAVLLLTAAANGSEVTSLSAVPRATVTATQLQLYLSRDAGTTLALLGTELMGAYTMAQTSKATPTYFLHPGNGMPIADANPLRLGPNDRLYVAIGVALAGGIQFAAGARDY